MAKAARELRVAARAVLCSTNEAHVLIAKLQKEEWEDGPFDEMEQYLKREYPEAHDLHTALGRVRQTAATFAEALGRYAGSNEACRTEDEHFYKVAELTGKECDGEEGRSCEFEVDICSHMEMQDYFVREHGIYNTVSIDLLEHLAEVALAVARKAHNYRLEWGWVE